MVYSNTACISNKSAISTFNVTQQLIQLGIQRLFVGLLQASDYGTSHCLGLILPVAQNYSSFSFRWWLAYDQWFFLGIFGHDRFTPSHTEKGLDSPLFVPQMPLKQTSSSSVKIHLPTCTCTCTAHTFSTCDRE